MRQSRWSLVGRICGVLSLLYLLSAAGVLLWGGYSFRFGALRLSSHSAAHDVLFAIVAGLAEFFLRPAAVERRSARLLAGLERSAPWLTGAASIVVFIVGLVFGTNCACGADAYGYVSQAGLWAKGVLHVPEPMAALVSWRLVGSGMVFTPLGYRPATYPGAMVPTYAPGLPLVMAAAMTVARYPSAAFVVVPLFGGVAVWCTFLLGRRFGGSLTGLWSAILLACSTTFIFQVIQPMSDVPVTAWWLLAMVLLVQETSAGAALAGLAASWAVLTRPNLVPLVPVCLLLMWWPSAGTTLGTAYTSAPRFRRMVLFCLGALPGPLLVAWINKTLYGSPALSGYGDLGGLFAGQNFWPNVRLYPQWLWETHGPFLFVGLVSPVAWMLRRRTVRHSAAAASEPAVSEPAKSAGRFLAFALAFTAVLFAEYAWYAVFDGWTYTRFLLPAIPLLLLLGVWTIMEGARAIAPRASSSTSALVWAAVLFVFAAISFLRNAVDHNVFRASRGERRNVEAGRYVAATTSPKTLVLAMQHSGSIRYYGDRGTVRYDWLDSGELDRAILDLHEMNRGPLLVLDDWEELDFKLRFRGQRWGALDWPPRAEFDTQPPARVYDPFDRDRYVAHQPVHTMHFK